MRAMAPALGARVCCPTICHRRLPQTPFLWPSWRSLKHQQASPVAQQASLKDDAVTHSILCRQHNHLSASL